jgi:hypothetical protein
MVQNGGKSNFAAQGGKRHAASLAREKTRDASRMGAANDFST